MEFIVNTIIAYKWGILLTCEVLGWVFMGFMFYFRYFIQSNPLFWISTAISGAFGYIPHLSIPILIAIHEKSITALLENKGDFIFVLCIISIIVLGFTFGKRYVAKFDRYMFQLAERRRI